MRDSNQCEKLDVLKLYPLEMSKLGLTVLYIWVENITQVCIKHCY